MRRATQKELDKAWDEFRRVSMDPRMTTKEKLEHAINAAFAEVVEAPADAMVVEARVLSSRSL